MQLRKFSFVLCLLVMAGLFAGWAAGPVMAAGSPGTWQVSTVSENISYYPFASVAYGPDSVPHVAYRKNTTRTIMHAWRSGSTWDSETVGPSAGTFTTSVAIGPGGKPALSYGDGLYFGNMMFAGKNGSSWESTVVARGSMADAGQFSSLAFDRQGIPHITYNDGQVLASLYYATRNPATGTWEFSLIDDDGAYTGDAGYSSSLKIDASGHPHVAYISDNPWGLRYATLQDGTNWTITKLDELDRPDFFSRTYTGVSLALDSNGYPHISYYNQTTTDTAPAGLLYLSWNGTGWERETVLTLAKRDFTTALAIDSGDVPHIAYCDAANKSVNYATRSVPGTWTTRTVVQENHLLRMPALALDPGDRPGIVWYDMTGHALQFAQG